MVEKIKKKRGRKPKIKTETTEIKVPKKRGRKPKGGKIIKKAVKENKIVKMPENIILHLKCKTEDLKESNDVTNYTPNLENPESFSMNNSKLSKLTYKELYLNNNVVKKTENVKIESKETNKSNKNSMKKIWSKLDELKLNLRTNNASDKKSACFWCTYEFDNPAVFIPKQYNNNLLEVYGCFCSPECAGYLKNEDIDSSRKWERYTFK